MRADRLVLDTNMLISSLLRPKGPTGACLRLARLHEGSLLFSHETFEELATRIIRSKFDRYASRSDRVRFLDDLNEFAGWVTITVHACRDPDDDKFLETALLGRADGIVSGDADLLELGAFEGIPILTPRGFLDRVTAP